MNVRHQDHRSFVIAEAAPGHYLLNIVCDGLAIVQIALDGVSESEANRLADHLQRVAKFVMTPDIGPTLQAYCDQINAARDGAQNERS